MCQAPLCSPSLQFLWLTNQCSAYSTCSMTYHELSMSQDLGAGAGGGAGRGCPLRKDRKIEDQRHSEHRFGPHHKSFRMETKAERFSQSASPEQAGLCLRLLEGADF